MDNASMATAIIKEVGGTENITGASHCVTRLRLTVKDDAAADLEAIKGIDGVIDCVLSSGQVQIVIGAGVDAVCDELVKQTGDALATPEQAAQADGEQQQERPKGLWNNIKYYASMALDTLVSCFLPAIPLFSGSGMIKVIAILLSYAGIITSDSVAYTILDMMGDACFYFLPIVVAYNAANKMHVDVMLSMALGFIIMSPTLLELGDTGTTVSFFGLPVTILDYSTQALPTLFGVWLLKYVDRFSAKVSPKIVSVFLRPLISLLIVGTFELCVIGPIASWLNDAVFAVCLFMQDWGWLAVALNACIFPFLVITGTHNATVPLIVEVLASQGYDTIFLVSGLAVNFAQAGAAFAVGVKTKNKSLRSTAFSATLQALLGVTEPALYGVNLRMGRPFISMVIGAFIGGALMGAVGLSISAFATPSVITMLLFIPSDVNFFLGLGVIVADFVITFVITYIVGFKDLDPDAEVEAIG